MSDLSGIYAIRNLVNGKVYVGSAVNLLGRWASHRHHLIKGDHHSQHLQHAWNKYGAYSFVHEVLEFVTNAKNLVEREQHWIDYYKAATQGYNIHPNARSPLGVKRSETTRAKLRKVKHPWLIKRNKSRWMRSISSITAAKRNRSLEMRAAVSARINPLLGYKHTEEARAKISASKLGKKRPDLKHGKDGRFVISYVREGQTHSTPKEQRE